METQKFVQAFKTMRKGILISLIGWLLLGIGITSLIFGTKMMIAELFFGLIVTALGALIVLLGFYIEFIPGVSMLAEADADYLTASKLIKVGYIWGILIIIVGAILSLFLIGIPILIIGMILLVLGFVGIILLNFNLYSKEKNNLYLVAAIFFIISIFITFLGIVAWILLYVALGETVKKYSVPYY